MKNKEVFERDPAQNKLLNQGVAKVTSGQTDSELDTLRFELTNFVSDGQYGQGLSRILSTFLGTLDKTEQPGVWVSGFFGSGKSHLVKVLQHLWSDFKFPDGATARGLTKLQPGIKELLIEHAAAARRAGGVHSAAGTLGISAADKSVRLELLGILFKSVGLPEHYHIASFVLFLRHEGLLEGVQKHVTAAGRNFDLELSNLYVSDAIANAILAVRPGFAASPADVKRQIDKQFPERTDISIDDMIVKFKQVLAIDEKLPLTLIVLDEVQQYIGDSVDRSKAIQDLQEQVCARLGANIMFVATGQNALSGTAHLQRLQGRFPVTIDLQDTDVETVTREVVLKKKQSVEPSLKRELEHHSGEIERHLKNSKLAFTTRDRNLLVQDYPLLPGRRRFWEKVLRAVDKAGTGAQLRTQLWIVYDAVERTAELPVGNVVSASYLFEHIRGKVIQSGVLLPEIAETIARQTQVSEDGDLRCQLCALIFLIGQLPHEGPNDAGIRADPETLADLLVTDLNAGSSELRKKVPALLKAMAEEGAVMLVDTEYRMQTKEGSAWNQAYTEAYNKLLGDAGKLASERSQLLHSKCVELLDKKKLLHGVAKEPRKFELHFGSEPPATTGSSIPVWIRDGWEVKDSVVLAEARSAGDSAAVVYGHIPSKEGESLKRAVASFYAAATTVQLRGNPSTPEGMEAKKAMETRRDLALRSRDQLISDILHETTIHIAGGETVSGLTLDVKVQDAASACLDRLYEKFHQADSADWHKVIERARKGDGDALSAVGHKSDPSSHAVCSTLLSYIGSGKKGNDIRKQFAAPPYGWPQDAVDAALMVMHRAGLILARVSGQDLLPKDKLDQKNIPTLEFRVEDQPLTTVQLIAIRKLYGEVIGPVQVGQESPKAPAFLAEMDARAKAAGGEPPLPQRPSTTHIADLGNRIGNDQLKAIFDQQDILRQQAKAWSDQAKKIALREPQWRTLRELWMHAGDLPDSPKVKADIEAIESGRKLLADPDPVPGLIADLAQALRDAMNALHKDCQQRYVAGSDLLAASPTWEKIASADRTRLLALHKITDVPEIAVGTPTQILDSLRFVRLKEWQSLRDALPTRFEQVLKDAAKLLEPKVQYVKLESTIIKSDADLASWLKSSERTIKAMLTDGPVSV